MIDFRSVDRTRLYGSTSGAVSVTVQSAVITVPSSYTTRSGPSGRSASRNSPLCSSLVRDRVSLNTRLDSCSGVIEVPSRMLAIVGDVSRHVRRAGTYRPVRRSRSVWRASCTPTRRVDELTRGDAVPSGFGPRCRRRSGASFGCVTSCHLDGLAERPHLWWWTRRVCFLTGREDPTRPERGESKVATGGAANAIFGDRHRGQALGSGYLGWSHDQGRTTCAGPLRRTCVGRGHVPDRRDVGGALRRNR